AGQLVDRFLVMAQPPQQKRQLVSLQLSVYQRRQLRFKCLVAHNDSPSGWPNKRPKFLVDRFARPEDPGANRAYGAVHRLSDLLIAQSFELAQGDRGTKILRQLIDCLDNRAGDLVALDDALRGLLIL